MALRTSSVLPAALARLWFMSVTRAAAGRPAPAATDTILLARLRASSRAVMKAPEPVFTSITRASSPAARFFDRMEAVMSGTDSTVAVTSRTA